MWKYADKANKHRKDTLKNVKALVGFNERMAEGLRIYNAALAEKKAFLRSMGHGKPEAGHTDHGASGRRVHSG